MKEIAQKISRSQADILATRITEAEYKPKHDEWAKRQNALVMSTYKKVMPPNINRIIAKLPEVIRLALPLRAEFSVNFHPELSSEERGGWSNNYVRLDYRGEDGEKHLCNVSGWGWMVEDDMLHAQAKALDDQWKRMRSECEKFREELVVSILIAKTNVKLKAMWPEHEKIIDAVIGVKFDNGTELKDGALHPQSIDAIRARVQKALPAPGKVDVDAEETIERVPQKKKRKPITIEG